MTLSSTTQNGTSSPDSQEQIKCRIQFVNDIDPFRCSSTNAGLHREPIKPIQCNLQLHRSISEQLPELIKLLRAPHKSGDCCLQVQCSGIKNGDEFASYLDSELTLSEQTEELELLQNEPLKNIP
uniref:FHOD1 N-terminal GTPase-binding domain-containing protein n=1 Tax=Meloidogyne javanica TaxID=6303 RepID=A0A915LEK5_MELJA